jgi:dTDP-4-amino-4,6-dideoxygalactose transaminase
MTTTSTRSVPFLALGGMFEQDDVDAAARVNAAAAAAGGNFFPLPEENQFQQAFAEFEGARHAIAVNSCGTALDACMMVLGIKAGDEVITSPLTFICSATCASALGAKVVFADVDPATLCLDPAKVRAKITPRTRAIIPVHFAGLACDVDGFDAITRDTGIPVIYDAAHAVGTRHNGKPIGPAGLASCYSFQSNKNITTLGEGGAVTTNDPDFAEKVRQKKTFGYVYGGPKLRIPSLGFNYRMTKPQLAVGVTQIAKARRVIDAKLHAFSRMNELLADVSQVTLPAGISEGHGAHLFVVRVPTIPRDVVAKHLKDKFNVGTAHHYPIVWTWEVFKDLSHDNSNCDHAVAASEHAISLPVFAQSTEEDLKHVADALKQTIHDLKAH